MIVGCKPVSACGRYSTEIRSFFDAKDSSDIVARLVIAGSTDRRSALVTPPDQTFAAWRNATSAGLHARPRLIKAANIDIQLTDHMLLDLWKKFVLLSGTSGMTATTRQPLGVIRDDDDMRAFLCKLMHDTMAVGRAAGVQFPSDFQAELDHSVATFPPTMKASMASGG
jgi:ketopantoate reductase